MSTTTIDRINGINSGVAIKAPVRVATTANITLSGEQTIDGVAVVADDRVLVKNQTSGVDNGIYVASTSAWTRDLDFDGARDVVTGTVVYVVAGTTNANSAWQITTTGEITPGTASITFAQSANLSAASAFMLTLLDDTTAAAARATLLALGDFSTLTAETAVAIDDIVPLYDTSEAAANKMTVNNLFKTVNAFTEDTTPAGATDFVLTYDTSATDVKKVKPTNLLKSINDLSTVTIDTAADYVPFYDASGAVAGKCLASAISSSTVTTTTTASSSASVTFGSLDFTVNVGYQLFANNVLPATDAVNLEIRVTDDGATYDLPTSLASMNLDGGGPAADFTTVVTLSQGNAAGEHAELIATISQPLTTGKVFMAFNAHFKNTAGTEIGRNGQAYWNYTAICTGIRAICSSGNISTGTFTLKPIPR